MAQNHARVKTLFNFLCESAGERNVAYYEGYIRKIDGLLKNDKGLREGEKHRQMISDAVIAQTLSVDDSAVSAPHIWYEYWVDVDASTLPEILHLRAKQDFVASVVWQEAGKRAEVKL
jgi:hypothetical protein